MTPTTQQINQAKRYIQSRVDTELKAYYMVESFLNKAVKDIIRLSYKYKTSPIDFKLSSNARLNKEVDIIIERLKMQITAIVNSLSVPKKENKDEIHAFIYKEKHGQTFKQRLDTYSTRYKRELETLITAGLVLGMSEKALTNSIKENALKPYMNPIINKAIQKGANLKHAGISYGVGRTNAMTTALQNLTRATITDGWMHNLLLENHHSKFFYSMRGSSYPCSFCDDMVGIHPIEEYTGAWHARCKCIIIFSE